MQSTSRRWAPRAAWLGAFALLLWVNPAAAQAQPAQEDTAAQEEPAQEDTAGPAPESAPPQTPIAPQPTAAPPPSQAAPPAAAPPGGAPPTVAGSPRAPNPALPPTNAAVTTPSPAPSAEPVDQGVDAQLYGGIVVSAIGAGLLVIAGIAVSSVDEVQEDPGFVAYRGGFQPDQDVCVQAEAGMRVEGAASPQRVSDLCDEATRWEITSYVAVPGGIALLGMGLYLTLTSDTAQEDAAVSFMPILGPTVAGLTMSGRF